MITTDDRIVTLDYEITYDSDLNNDLYHITPEVHDLLQVTYDKAIRKKNSVIRELNDLIKKYPHVPQFKNHLCVIYSRQGNLKRAHEVNDLIVKEHPDYLFGKINLANKYILNKEYDKVPAVLGELMEIKALYPERTIFHVTEVIAFYKCAIAYFVGIEDLEAAESRLNILKQIDEKNDDIDFAERLVMVLRLKKGFERMQTMTANNRSVESVSKKVIEPTDKKPEFIHPQIEQLYCNDKHISNDLLKEILSLPRQSLISDLNNVLYDSIARYNYFNNEDETDNSTTWFPVHALFLLTEMKAEESLPVVLDVLRQDEEFLEFWFDDLLTEDFWETNYILGRNQLELLKDFMLEPDNYCFARSAVSEAVSQAVLHEPRLRNEALQWYNDVLTWFIMRKDDDGIIDYVLNALIVGDLLDIEAKELEPVIKALYEADIVDQWGVGVLQDVLKDLHHPDPTYRTKKREVQDIFSKYEDLCSWNKEEEEGDFPALSSYNQELFERRKDIFENYESEPDTSDYFYKGDTPLVLSFPKIGRNDRCHCGSGIKFKKCHGKAG